MAKTLKLEITNAYTGDYTGRIYVGSEKQSFDVILDTGSSALALDGNRYNPQEDSDAKITDITQHANYGYGNLASYWRGGIVLTNITFGEGENSVSLNGVCTAATYTSKNFFRNSHGILGLAYAPLDTDLYRYVDGQEYQLPQNEALEPYFTQLEKKGLVANKFSFYTLRSFPAIAEGGPENNPLNKGFLIFGGGEEYTELYEGPFKTVKVVHDRYYNVNLKSIRVGDRSQIEVPQLSKEYCSNCIVDSGTNGLTLPISAYQDVLDQFKDINPEFKSIINQTLKNPYNNYLQSGLSLDNWPSIYVTLEGDGEDVELEIKPDTYWQLDTGQGEATLAIFPPNDQGILGLPFMNNYFCVFDRSADNNVGVIKFANIKK